MRVAVGKNSNNKTGEGQNKNVHEGDHIINGLRIWWMLKRLNSLVTVIYIRA